MLASDGIASFALKESQPLYDPTKDCRLKNRAYSLQTCLVTVVACVNWDVLI